MIYYAGIGSRRLPRKYRELFIRVGKYLAEQGCVLRSGRAEGADESFEIGCDLAYGKKEIYVPWKNFMGAQFKKHLLETDKSNYYRVEKCYVLASEKENPNPYLVAETYHPMWGSLKDSARRLQARNSHQVLGLDLETPSNFIICWTKDGLGQGGTGQALRIAKDKNIPIFDCGKYEDINECRRDLFEFIKKYI